MTLVLAWIAFPIVLALLSLGCGLLLETASGMRLPGTLLVPGGFIVISIAVYFAHMSDRTAPLQTPFVVALALSGYALSPPWKRFQLDRWATGAAVAVYAVFAAPVVLVGTTFAGYVRLDDTATFIAFLDRATNHGYGAAGLAPSTYKATLLSEGYKHGYPLGSMLPLDVGHTILRVDQLWLWQPYLTFLAVLAGLGLYELASGLLQSRALRACVAFLGAQAALFYGYAMWGGVKELFAPGVVLFAACLVPRLKVARPREVIPLAVASAAVIGGLSVGGAIWLLPILAAGLTLLVLNPLDAALLTAASYAVTTGVLSLPILAVSKARLNTLSKFEKVTQLGNLGHPLSWWQIPGEWNAADFRGRPSNLTLAHLLAALIVVAAIFAAVIAWRRRRWEIVVALATAAFSCLVYFERASPWVAGKAFASSSPLVLGVGVLGAAVVIEAGRRVEGGVVLAVIAATVLLSNFMQYRGVLVAPSARLMELETIGAKFSGKGPALLTESESYAARHFLRGLAAQTASGLRVNQNYLRNGSTAPVGVSPDVDEIRLDQLLQYPLLITRRTGVASRPPSAYTLAKGWSGRYYDVWRKTSGGIIEHMSLGSRLQPAGVPDCNAVMKLAARASAAHGVLEAVFRPEAIVIQPNGHIGAPTHFIRGGYGEPYGLTNKTKAFTLTLPFTVRSGGTYGLWVGGSFSSTLTAKLDGHKIGQQRNQTEWPGNFLNFGSAHLSRGPHTLVIRHSGPDWGPGSAAKQPFGLGPFVIAQGTDDRSITYIQPNAARALCGKSLDWIEAVRTK
jgi:hypothetical protein